MNDLWKYLIESAVSLCLFYGIYWIFLRRDTFFTRNRFYLALTIFLSMIIPLLSVSIRQPAPIYTIEAMLDEAVIAPASSLNVPTGDSPRNLFTWFYLAGAVFFLLKFLVNTGQIVWLIKRYGITRENGLRIVYMDRNLSPFSFYNIIFLNGSLTGNDYREKIIAHEMNHIRNMHTLDLVVFELLTIIQWFNPVAWLYKWSLKEVHEYQADESVIRGGHNALNYQELVLSQVFGNQFFRVAHNLNSSLIKKRIVMMTKFKSSKVARYKILLALPAALLVIALFSFSNNSPDHSVGTTPTLFPDPSINAPQDTAVYIKVDTMPKFQGGDMEKFRRYLALNIRYPEEAREKNITGTVYVQFVVNQRGKVDKVQVIRGVDPLLDSEALRVVLGSPVWEPGIKNGEKVSIAFTFPVAFVLSEKESQSQPQIPSVDPDNPDVYFLVEEMPMFRGSKGEAFRDYVSENLRYPREAMEKGISGKIFVQFVVNREGLIEDVTVVKSVDPLLDKEAIRVVANSPAWTPGKQGGKCVKVRYTFPIVFTLPDESRVPTQNSMTDSETGLPVFYVVEQMPRFQGSDNINAFNHYVTENLVYPEEALKKGISCTVYISFVVDREGNVRDVKMERGIAEFEKEAIRVVQSSPKWEPGIQREHKVDVAFTIPVTFLLPANWEKQPLPADIKKADEQVFFVVEEMPKFQGGDFSTFRQYIAENLVYPDEAKKKNISGTVYVQMVVTSEGKVDNVKVIRGADPLLDKEALRVVMSSPEWEPGLQKGNKVNVAFTFPVIFELSDKLAKNTQDETVVVGLKSKISDDALYLIDGKIVSHDIFSTLNPDHIESVEVIKGESAIEKYGEKGKNGVIYVTMKSGDNKPGGLSFRVIGIQPGSDILFLIDGEKVKMEEVKLLNISDIQSIEVLKGEKAEKEFGDAGIGGVVKITMK